MRLLALSLTLAALAGCGTNNPRVTPDVLRSLPAAPPVINYAEHNIAIVLLDVDGNPVGTVKTTDRRLDETVSGVLRIHQDIGDIVWRGNYMRIDHPEITGVPAPEPYEEQETKPQQGGGA